MPTATPFQHEAIIATPSPRISSTPTPSPSPTQLPAMAMNEEPVEPSAATGTSDVLVVGILAAIAVGGLGLAVVRAF